MKPSQRHPLGNLAGNRASPFRQAGIPRRGLIGIVFEVETGQPRRAQKGVDPAAWERILGIRVSQSKCASASRRD